MLIVVLILLCVAFIVFSTTRLKLHPFLALLAAALFFGLFSGMSLETIIASINQGFGSTVGSIGIIIIAGIVIGTFLEQSGGAYALAGVILRLIGPKRIHQAMAVIGYIVSIPVFADSGFIILSPLNRALTKKSGLSLAGTAIALSLGLMATHTMVPPTPGPIAAAGILGADVGLVIIIGLGASIWAAGITTLFARRVASRVFIDPNPDLSPAQVEKITGEAPSALKSFLPIILPLVLIVLKSVADFPTEPFGTGQFRTVARFIGNPMVALIIGMILAFMLPKKLDRAMLSASGWVGRALKDAAIIILITGAGGAFGRILQNSDFGILLEDSVRGSGLGLWLPFLVAAALKTAQGSSTVAIITTASLMMPLLGSLGLDSEVSRAMVVVATGAGAAVVSHANDSYFWVVTQMSDMSVKDGYRLLSSGSAVLGFSAMILLSLVNLFI